MKNSANEEDERYMSLTPVYGRKIFTDSTLSKAELRDHPLPASSVYQLIKNQLLIDAKPGLNLATFCNEACPDRWGVKLIEESINKNFIDHTEYPGSNLAEKRSIRMIAKELGTQFDESSPINKKQEADQKFYGTATIGSSEAVMLGLIAHKFIWDMKHRVLLDNYEKIGIKVDPRDKPVVLMSSHVHGCWDKFCRYYGAVPLYIKIDDSPYAINGKLIYEILTTEIDDPNSPYAKEIRKRMGYKEPQTGRTIGELVMCVGAVVGSTFTGNYDDVKSVDDFVDQYCNEQNKKYNQEQKAIFDTAYRELYAMLHQDTIPTKIPDFMDIPIHVDAASAGFVLMFSENGSNIKFNFEDCQKRVLSINVSNHKFGMTLPGMGTVVFKNSSVVDKSLIYHIAYLGGSFDDYTVNFSRGSSMIVMQYYNFLRFGRNGYKKIMDNCVNNAEWFIESIHNDPYLKRYLKNISNINPDDEDKKIYLPVIALTWSDEQPSGWDLTDLSDRLAQQGWVVPAYNIPKYSPEDTEGIQVLRIVVQQVVSRDKLTMLLESMKDAIKELESDNEAKRLESPAAFLKRNSIERLESDKKRSSKEIKVARHTACLC